jgi:hypothetical protein
VRHWSLRPSHRTTSNWPPASKCDQRGDGGQHKCNLRLRGSTCAPLLCRPRSTQQSVVGCLAQMRLVLLLGVPLDKEFIPHGLHLSAPLIKRSLVPKINTAVTLEAAVVGTSVLFTMSSRG